jgi:hypothetical protein
MKDCKRPIEVKINIKPVYHFMIHSGLYEGPCTAIKRSYKQEKSAADKNYELFKQSINQIVSNDSNILEPVYLEYSDDWEISDKEFDKFDDDLEETDVFLISSGHSLAQFVAVEIAKKFKKPVLFVYNSSDNNRYTEEVSHYNKKTVPMGVDAISHLRFLGLEGYLALDYNELYDIISILKIRKAVSETRVLRIIGNRFDHVDGNFLNPIHLTNKFGLEFKDISIQHFKKEFDKITDDANMQKKASNITDRLIEKAHKNHMTKENIIPSVYFYLTAEKLIEDYKCNSFTVHCLEICPDRRIASMIKATPCLTHCLLREMGMPAACEADLTALLSVIMMMYVSQKDIYFGNIFIKNREENIMYVSHDLPGLKMKGLNEEWIPYEIKNFTAEGWGATIRYDFARDNGEKVNLVRFSPSGEKILVTKGEIVGSEDIDRAGCTMKALIKVNDVDEYIHKCEDFGNHSVVIYGDYTEKMKVIGRYMGFEVVEA